MQSKEVQENQVSNIDIKELFFKYLAFLHWIVFGAIIALTCAFFYLRYSQEVYQASNVIKILDNNNSGFKMPSDALSFFSRNKVNLENETEVLQSSLLIERVVDELDLQNTYFTKGNIKETEIGPSAPFYIKWLETSDVVNKIHTIVELEVANKGFYVKNQKELKLFGRVYSHQGNKYSIHLKDDAKKTTFIIQNNAYRVVKNHPHARLIEHYRWLYSTSANESGKEYDEYFCRTNTDIIIEDSRGFITSKPSTILKLTSTHSQKLR